MSAPPSTAPRPSPAGLLLAGCSALEGLAGGVEPERDAESGGIVAVVRADAFSLRVGDASISAPGPLQAAQR